MYHLCMRLLKILETQKITNDSRKWHASQATWAHTQFSWSTMRQKIDLKWILKWSFKAILSGGHSSGGQTGLKTAKDHFMIRLGSILHAG